MTMPDKQGYKEYLSVQMRLKPNTVGGYCSGLNYLSKHCGQDLCQITDLVELDALLARYQKGGVDEAHGIGYGHGNAYHGLKQWRDYVAWMQGGGNTPTTGNAEGGLLTGQAEQGLVIPLNQILYGPPGTGKTYETVRAALKILDPAAVGDYDAALAAAVSLEEKSQARETLKDRFDQLCAEDRIRFVTFHQSFSYEDFVEGLRAESTEGQVQYRVEPGVFLRVCRDAVATPESVDLEVRLARFIDEVAETPAMLATATGKLFKVSYRAGNTTLTCEPQSSESEIRLPASIEQVRCELAGRPVENPYCSSYVKGIAAHLRQQQPILQSSTSRAGGGKPYVLIIDEINRGNISRIFGELITLIEPSKRAGAAEALEVTLPYSKQAFKVPDNVYLIGTMNTADRSLAGLDLALRRRFTFTEMPPKPELLDGVEVEGVNIGQMLRVMNQRITVLLDRDHTLGHAYFMPLQDDPSLDRLSAIFRQSILPLLQEYFFEDWERIRWVLNDQSKPEGAAFIVEDRTLSLAGLFPGVHDKLRPRPQWRVNVEAFDLPAAYAGIVGARSETQHNPPVATAPSEMAAVG